MDPETLTTSPGESPPRRRRATLVIAVLFVAAWLIVLVFRMELRSHYWAYRLAGATSEAQRRPYLVRLAAAEDHALGALAGLLDDPSPEVRGDAIYLLGKLDSLPADKLLFDVLEDESDANAWQAAVQLSRRIERKEIYAELSRRFETTSGRDWEYTAVTMGLSSHPDFLRALVRETEQADDPDRLAVLIDALRLARSNEARPILQRLLDDDRPVSITPPSERHILKMISSLGPELQEKGIDIRTLTPPPDAESTVADMARRALEMIESPPPAPGTPATLPQNE